MKKSILTIDDAPTKITPQIVDYLKTKKIHPVINFIGAAVADHFDEAVYAAKSGAVIGNHSFSHPHFSEISIDECREEIRKTEDEIDRVYEAASLERKYKVFRFPYGDKGGDNYDLIQKMLRDEFHFARLDSSEVTYPFWKHYHLDTDIDMKWSFDFVEYELAWDNDFSWETILHNIHDEHPEQGGVMLSDTSVNIVLMHDMESTNRCVDKYYEKLIDYVMDQGVTFMEPRFHE